MKRFAHSNISLFLVLYCFACTFAERDWAKIQNGTMVTDKGDLIRGCHSHIHSFAKDKYKNLSWWQKLRDNGHLNCVRMMAYNSPWWYRGGGSGNSTSDLGNDLDVAVENAAKAGMYIIIDDHSFCCGSQFNLSEHGSYGFEFWEYVAPRYAQYRHVIYEIKNEPNDITGGAMTNHWKALYKLIRKHAPNTPVLTLSPGGSEVKDIVDAINETGSGDDAIQYNPNSGNVGISFHGYGEGNFNSAKTNFETDVVYRARQKAGVVCGEFGAPGTRSEYEYAQFCDKKGISWIWLCPNEMEFGEGTSIKTGYDGERFPPKWPKDQYAVDMDAGPGNATRTVNKDKYGHINVSLKRACALHNQPQILHRTDRILYTPSGRILADGNRKTLSTYKGIVLIRNKHQ
jgi:hypothetical protein